MRLTIILIVIVSMIGFNTAQSQSVAKSLGMYVFPAQDQSPDQQELDEFKCYQWAKEQTGFDPMNPTKVTPKEVETGPDGTAVRTAAKGAAMGAAIGAIAGDAGKGAAIGAATGGFGGIARKKSKDAHMEQKSQTDAKQQEQAMVNDYKKAFTVCLEGKGYTVK